MSSDGMSENFRIGTKAIHAGQSCDQLSGAVVTPISLSTTFAWPRAGQVPGMELPSSLGIGFDYSRSGNPTRGTLETCLTEIVGAKYTLCYASGLAAVSAVIHILNSGDHIITYVKCTTKRISFFILQKVFLEIL